MNPFPTFKRYRGDRVDRIPFLPRHECYRWHVSQFMLLCTFFTNSLEIPLCLSLSVTPVPPPLSLSLPLSLSIYLSLPSWQQYPCNVELKLDQACLHCRLFHANFHPSPSFITPDKFLFPNDLIRQSCIFFNRYAAREVCGVPFGNIGTKTRNHCKNEGAGTEEKCLRP